MKKVMSLIVFTFILSSLFSETIVLKDGRELNGQIVAKQGEMVYLQTDKSLFSINESQLHELKMIMENQSQSL